MGPSGSSPILIVVLSWWASAEPGEPGVSCGVSEGEIMVRQRRETYSAGSVACYAAASASGQPARAIVESDPVSSGSLNRTTTARNRRRAG
jgi:hypothetical protein